MSRRSPEQTLSVKYGASAEPCYGSKISLMKKVEIEGRYAMIREIEVDCAAPLGR
jgi:hypothetical protein